MRLTMRSHYGTHAVIELARHYGRGPVQSAEIAARQNIPEAYLDQLLCSLRRAGIVRSLRGPHGGHELARHPRELTVGDVVTALEGPVVPPDLSHTAIGAVSSDNPEAIDWWNACAVRNVWHAAAEASQRVLDAATIQGLLEEQILIRAHRQELAHEPTAPATPSR